MWLRLEVDLPTHPKILRAGERAGWIYISALCYAARYQTNGHIPSEALPLLGCDPDCLTKLISTGLWELAEGGYQIHDWGKYQFDTQQKLAMRSAKAKAGKKGAAKRWRDKN